MRLCETTFGVRPSQTNGGTEHNLAPAASKANKLLFVAASTLLLTVSASAATMTVNCAPYPANIPGGNGTPNPPIQCPGFSLAGQVLTGVTLNYGTDFQFGAVGTDTVSTTFTPMVTGVTFTMPTTTVVVTGTGNGPGATSSGAPGTGSATASAGVSAAAFANSFNVSTTATTTQGSVATSAAAVSVTYTYAAAPPPAPPPPTACNAAAPTIGAGGVTDGFQVHYFSNLDVADSVIDITNSGASSTVAFGPTGAQNGNLCVNTYTFSPDEQLISCCSCLVTPDGLAGLSVRNNLINNTLTPGVPTSVVVKLVASTPNGQTVASGLAAWGTNIHAAPVGGFNTPGTFGTTETPFTQATLTQPELSRITQLCGFIQNNGSGFGVCAACNAMGIAGAAKKY